MQITIDNAEVIHNKIEKDVHTLVTNEKRDFNCHVTVDHYVNGVVKTLTFKGNLLGFTGAVISDVSMLSAISSFVSEDEKTEQIDTDLTQTDGRPKTVKPTSIPSLGKQTNGLHG